MESFEAAHGTPVATITHVSDMSKLMEEVRMLLWPPLLRTMLCCHIALPDTLLHPTPPNAG